MAILHIVCATDNMSGVRRFVDEFTESHLSAKDVGLVTLAVDEVCSNLLEHGNCANIWVQLDAQNEGVVITIRDDGTAFDINAYKPRTLQELVAGRHTGGLGLLLVQKVMDTIIYQQQTNLNECCLYKKGTSVLA